MLTKKKVAAEKNISADDSMILTAEESIYFKDEINKQLAESKIIDIGKAVRNARYLAMLDRGFEDMKTGKGVRMTFEELERLINEERRV